MNTNNWRLTSMLRLLVLSFAVAATGCGDGGKVDDGLLILSQDTGAGTTQTLLPGTAPPVAPGTSVAATGPTVPFSNPTDGATNVPVSTVGPGDVLTPRTISAGFSEAMNPATIVSPAASFTVKESVSGTSIAGSVSMNSESTLATFTPSAALPANTQFTATVTVAATNTNGTPLAGNYGWSFTTGSQIGQAPVNLGAASGFVVLGGTSIANFSTALNPTRVQGQLGIDPGNTSNVTGFTASTPTGSGVISTGGIQFGPVVNKAKNDLLIALNDANARTTNRIPVGVSDLATFRVNGGIPGVYPPGLYSSTASLSLNSGDITLDAQGDPDAVWVFQSKSDLNVGDTRQIVLRNAAKSGNVFWSVGSSANIGDRVSFRGNILAGSSNTIGTGTAIGTTVVGRVLSVSGLTLYSATIDPAAP